MYEYMCTCSSGALAASHKGKSRVDAEADFDRLFICIVGVEYGVM